MVLGGALLKGRRFKVGRLHLWGGGRLRHDDLLLWEGRVVLVRSELLQILREIF